MGPVILVFSLIAYHYSKVKMYEKVSNMAFCIERKVTRISQTIQRLVRSKIQKKNANSRKKIERRESADKNLGDGVKPVKSNGGNAGLLTVKRISNLKDQKKLKESPFTS